LVQIRVWATVRVYLLYLPRLYQAYCTLVMCYCHVTEGGRIRLQIQRSTGGSIATAFSKTANRRNFRPNDLQKNGQKKPKRPTQKSYGQPTWNTAKFQKFGRKTANLATLL